MTSGPLGEPDVGAALRDALAAMAEPIASSRPLALGWATVDLDRAERAYRDVFAATLGGVADAPDDVLLGATCRTLRTGDDRIPVVVLLEPFTEGRLAATLARHGEGPVAVWLQGLPDAADETAGPSPSSSPRRSVPSPGPFGTETLLLDGPATGPHRLILLTGAGTITP